MYNHRTTPQPKRGRSKFPSNCLCRPPQNQGTTSVCQAQPTKISPLPSESDAKPSSNAECVSTCGDIPCPLKTLGEPTGIRPAGNGDERGGGKSLFVRSNGTRRKRCCWRYLFAARIECGGRHEAVDCLSFLRVMATPNLRKLVRPSSPHRVPQLKILGCKVVAVRVYESCRMWQCGCLEKAGRSSPQLS